MRGRVAFSAVFFAVRGTALMRGSFFVRAMCFAGLVHFAFVRCAMFGAVMSAVLMLGAMFRFRYRRRRGLCFWSWGFNWVAGRHLNRFGIGFLGWVSCFAACQ